jgi:hypothetical protein
MQHQWGLPKPLATAFPMFPAKVVTILEELYTRKWKSNAPFILMAQ